ncbi:MAG: orotidine-5'-phosphate decarboxylase [bacterium]|nr:orotidine-5'-phosphate decarboxylase [bacterium]
MKDNRIILALDVSDPEKARSLVEMLIGQVACVKIGLELITALGAPKAIQLLKDLGAKVFFDGKFHDIPNTVGRASAAVSRLGVRMFSVHASGGRESFRAAVAHKKESLVWGVTVLSSLEKKDSVEIYREGPDRKVIQFAHILVQEHADGIICSPSEAALLRKQAAFEHMALATPGVRPSWASKNDQKRTLTPQEAIQAGADYLIIGRPITEASGDVGSPLEAVKRINAEIDSVITLEPRILI